MKFMGKRLDEYFQTLPADQYPEEMKTYIAQVISGEAELTEELEKVYNVVAMPTQEVILQQQEEEKKKEEKSLALPKKEEKKKTTRSTSRGKVAGRKRSGSVRR
jgi:glutamine synthetase adenylyltransferase